MATQAQSKSKGHPAELFSIIMAAAATIGVPLFLWIAGSWNPDNKIYWTIPLWIGLFYLIIQMIILLLSATQVRELGVVNSAVAILPLVAGLVTLTLDIADHAKFALSNYQLNVLAVLIIVGAAEFLLTIWIRFIVNRRTMGFVPGAGGGDGN